ncbi:ribonuclease activity regulator RraA [Neorhizobium sp. DT-125]|uniref:RraA family protein n=1 Tax=Neorhizobium sp. DT-125 TaxID=3396163 RepID=UPI003F1DA8CA
MNSTTPSDTPLTEEVRDKLRNVTTATLTTLLLRRGFTNTFMKEVRPVAAGKRQMVGEAYTLRLVPYREDLGNIFSRDNRRDIQRVTVETMPEGHVLVIDSRGDAGAASCGEILVMRMMVRGVEGIVTDGGFRDSPSIGMLDIPTYQKMPAAPPIMVRHHPVEANCAIACGGLTVFPGDIVVGDQEGVVVIPRALAAEIADEAVKKEDVEEFIALCVLAGEPINDIYPPTPPLLERHAEWVRNGRKTNAVERMQA